MRQAITIVLLFSFNFICSQNPFRIVDTSKVWNTMHGGFGAFAVGYCSGTLSNKFSGNTIIGDKTYLNVYEASDSAESNWEQIGFIREDTINKLIYFQSWLDIEGLIYDFNLSVGDSIYIDNYYIGFNDALLICDSMDVVNINGHNKNRYFLLPSYSNEYYADVWIDGIGSIYGLLYSGIGGALYAGGFSTLLCCANNDTIIYFDSVFNSCYIDEFYPKITSPYFDTAYVGFPYEFQLQLSDTSTMDSIGWRGEHIPDNFSFDEATGILSGFPETPGVLPCIITVVNYDIGYITDIIESSITVILPSDIKSELIQSEIKIFPNPCTGQLHLSVNTLRQPYIYLDIIDYTGTFIEKRIISSKNTELDFTHYKEGVYLLKIYDPCSNIFRTEKAIKKDR